jgi:NADH:ubiquinone oxidoreductase subunit E
MSSPPLIESLAKKKYAPRDLIEVLHDLQEEEGYVSEDNMLTISESLGVPLIEVARIAHFYTAFHLSPRGRHLVTVCMGTACHVRGARRMLDEVSGQLGIEAGQTTEDGLFTMESVNCLGACALGPVVVIDGIYHDHMTPMKLRKLLDAVRREEGKPDA